MSSMDRPKAWKAPLWAISYSFWCRFCAQFHWNCCHLVFSLRLSRRISWHRALFKTYFSNSKWESIFGRDLKFFKKHCTSSPAKNQDWFACFSSSTHQPKHDKSRMSSEIYFMSVKSSFYVCFSQHFRLSALNGGTFSFYYYLCGT